MNIQDLVADRAEQLFYTIGQSNDHFSLIECVQKISGATNDAGEREELQRQASIRLAQLAGDAGKARWN
jgi:hypothetical protein